MMIKKFNGIIIAAGKVTKDSFDDLHKAIGAKEYHGKLIVGSLAASPAPAASVMVSKKSVTIKKSKGTSSKAPIKKVSKKK